MHCNHPPNCDGSNLPVFFVFFRLNQIICMRSAIIIAFSQHQPLVQAIQLHSDDVLHTVCRRRSHRRLSLSAPGREIGGVDTILNYKFFRVAPWRWAVDRAREGGDRNFRPLVCRLQLYAYSCRVPSVCWMVGKCCAVCH